MLFYLQHGGTEKHVRIYNNVKYKIEEYFGHKVQDFIGRNKDDLILYDSEENEVASFNTEPSMGTIEFLMQIA